MERRLLHTAPMLRTLRAPVLAPALALAAAACFPQSGAALATGEEADPVAITRECGRVPDDPIHLAAMSVEGNTLRVRVSYGGGCEAHEFAACWDGTVQDSNPGRLFLSLHHDGNGDACDAFITRDVLIDLSELSEIGFEAASGTVLDPDGRIQLVAR